MAAKAKKKASKAKKATARKASSKKTAKKKATARKKGATKKAKKAAAKKTRKKTGKKSAPAKKAKSTRKSATQSDAEDTGETTIALDELEEIDDLVADDAPATPKAKRSTAPRTPSVPRSVKPPPKDADMEMDDEVLGFIEAVETYRQEFSRPFPTWTEVFYILKQLGYTRR